MIQPVSKQRWQEAQLAESTAIIYDRDNCRHGYELIFQYLGLSFDQQDKSIIEVGCGGYPAVSFCENVHSTLIEPLWFDSLQEMRIPWIRAAVEDLGVLPHGDEVFMFNAMQHVRDPELFVAQCKQMAPVIRFFEPIDCETSDFHPHTFTMNDFTRWFGSAARYIGGTDAGFHTADCAYGSWMRNA